MQNGEKKNGLPTMDEVLVYCNRYCGQSLQFAQDLLALPEVQRALRWSVNMPHPDPIKVFTTANDGTECGRFYVQEDHAGRSHNSFIGNIEIYASAGTSHNGQHHSQPDKKVGIIEAAGDYTTLFYSLDGGVHEEKVDLPFHIGNARDATNANKIVRIARAITENLHQENAENVIKEHIDNIRRNRMDGHRTQGNNGNGEEERGYNNIRKAANYRRFQVNGPSSGSPGSSAL